MKRIDKRSILVRVIICIACVSVLQTVVFSGMLLFGGTIGQLNENSATVLINQGNHCAGNSDGDYRVDHKDYRSRSRFLSAKKSWNT